MVKSDILTLVISAIKNMRESKGSSSRDILRYISSVHDIPRDLAKRQLVAALKRGVAHGIIRKADGFYSLPTDTEAECMEVAAQELGLLDLSCRKKKREARRKGKDACQSASSRRKRKMRSGRKSGRHMKSGKVRRGRSRRHSRGGKNGCGCKRKSRTSRMRRSHRGKRSMRRGKSACRPRGKSRRSRRMKSEVTALSAKGKAKYRSDQLKVDVFDKDDPQIQSGRMSASRARSKSKNRSRSRSRSRARSIVVPAAQ